MTLPHARRIDEAVRWQEEIGLDVLVHGEFERNDMVKYFGEQLSGFAFTQHGWVQSYGSRCVAPPIIFGDVVAPGADDGATGRAMPSRCTDRPMKGMLTGPVTILQWSFVRDDLPRAKPAARSRWPSATRWLDLEEAGIGDHPDRRGRLARGPAAAPRRLGRLSRLGGANVSAWRRRRAPTTRRSTPICATRSSTTSSLRSPRWTRT